MKKLVEGLRHFVRTLHAEEQELFSRLAKAQKPDALFVTCSDSRIAPHLITQSGPGDLFVIRNAGNIIPAYGDDAGGEAASVEYAAAALEVADIIVCGHSNCGAMNGLLALEELGRDLPTVKAWLERCEPTRRIVNEQFAALDASQRLQRAIEVNVLVQLENLCSHPSVRTRLAAGNLGLHGWVYDIGSGHVRAFDSERGAFVSLIDSVATGSADVAEHATERTLWPILLDATHSPKVPNVERQQ
jgi:carbonic anhydrase